MRHSARTEEIIRCAGASWASHINVGTAALRKKRDGALINSGLGTAGRARTERAAGPGRPIARTRVAYASAHYAGRVISPGRASGTLAACNENWRAQLYLCRGREAAVCCGSRSSGLTAAGPAADSARIHPDNVIVAAGLAPNRGVKRICDLMERAFGRFRFTCFCVLLCEAGVR